MFLSPGAGLNTQTLQQYGAHQQYDRISNTANMTLPTVRHRVQDAEVSRPEPAEANVCVCPAEEEV